MWVRAGARGFAREPESAYDLIRRHLVQLVAALFKPRLRIFVGQSPRKTRSLDAAQLAYLHSGIARHFQTAKVRTPLLSPPSVPRPDLEQR